MDDLSNPAIEYELQVLPRDFVALPDGVAMVLFGSTMQAISLQEHRVLRQFRLHRFGINQMLFAPVTAQLYTTNPWGDFLRWDFQGRDPESIAQVMEEFVVPSGMTIDNDGRYRMHSISAPVEAADDDK